MPTTDIKIKRFARWLLEQFSATDQRRVMKTVESLRKSSPDLWPADQVTPHPEGSNQYMIRVSPGILVFIHWNGPGDLEILDIMHEQAYRVLSGVH